MSGAGSEETQNMWQRVCPVMKSVTPSGMLRWYREFSVGPKVTNRCNRVHRSENTCHLSSLDEYDLTKICNELDVENAEQRKKKSR